MSNLIFNEQDYFNSHPSTDAVISENPCIRPSDSTLGRLIDPFQLTSDNSYHACMPFGNALGLYGMCGPEFDWALDPLSYPSTTTTSNQTDTQLFNTSFSRLFAPSDSVWQTSASHDPFVREEAALSGVGDDLVPHSSQTMTLPGSRPALKRTAQSPSKRASTSRLPSRSIPPRSLRQMPYPIGSDSARRSASPTFIYQCQWVDGATSRPCGADVLGTKSAIGEHLETAHAIQLKADKTSQVCHWEACLKSMRRESIARHVLAVHMQDKVLCPSCRSRFARTDSLQRHQRTQCLAEGEEA